MTIQEASAAKYKIRQVIGKPSWLKGIGIGSDDEGYYVSVNVSHIDSEIVNSMPIDIPNIRIIIKQVEDIIGD